MSNSLPSIPENASLSQLQAYQTAICKARGWDKTSDLESFLLFMEEIGELAKAIRNRRELYQEEGKSSHTNELKGEFADVLSYLMELANRFGIDLETVYREKEAINAKRNWS